MNKKEYINYVSMLVTSQFLTHAINNWFDNNEPDIHVIIGNNSLKMAKEIKQCNDPWIEKHPTVGIIAWNGKNQFQVIKHCKINYSLAQNDLTTLAKGMISSLSRDMKKLLEGA